MFIHSMHNNLDLITPNSQSIPPPLPLGNHKSVVYKTHLQMPWRRAWQPTPVFLPGESPWIEELRGLQVHRVTKSWTRLKRLSTYAQLSIPKNIPFWKGKHPLPSPIEPLFILKSRPKINSHFFSDSAVWEGQVWSWRVGSTPDGEAVWYQLLAVSLTVSLDYGEFSILSSALGFGFISGPVGEGSLSH